ncbi:hypothetical protein J25TS5_37320 [Paenibacillus faecis]|uniref:hypothetical protein n=1 Tax=Paenibacillus faecis TaxID=862114 RepID=UPI001B10F186|nr:hypothetical protein [Paenibacillus faecis]GIO86800.1 hypothetical protein J25TS5_37320 [Paenibacillus faecis]
MSQAEQEVYQGAGFHIQFPYPITAVRYLHVDRQFNEHTQCNLSIVMTEEHAMACLEKGSMRDTVHIRRETPEGTEYWFSGGIAAVDMDVEDGIWHVSVRAISRTYDMDHQRMSRSYQNKNLTYTSLIKQLVAPYKDGDAMNEATEPDATIGRLLVQYQETDWQFMKRVASLVGTVILPDVVLDAPRVYFGVPDFSWGKQLHVYRYTMTQDRELYLQTHVGYSDTRTNSADYVSYEVTSRQYVQVGDNVSFKGQMWVVYSADMRYDQGIVTYAYKLVQRSGIRSLVRQNHRIQGVSLGGKVISRANNMVKVHLDIDEEHDNGGNWWFPYSSEGNNMFHALPEEGARINVYFPGGEEKKAIAVNAVRGRHEEMKGRTVFQKPTTKVFHVPGNAKMELGEDGVLFEKNTVRLHLNADDITLESDENILIVAANDLELGSKDRMPDYIKMCADSIISVYAGNQMIEVMEHKTKIRAPEINMNITPMSLLDMLNEQDIEDLYVDSLMSDELKRYMEEKKEKERNGWTVAKEVFEYVPGLIDYALGMPEPPEPEPSQEEVDGVRERIRQRIRQEPGSRETSTTWVAKQSKEALSFHYEVIHREKPVEEKKKSKKEKEKEREDYDDFYKSYVEQQTQIVEQQARIVEQQARINDPEWMEGLTNQNSIQALQEETSMLRAIGRERERQAERIAERQAEMKSGTASLGEQLMTAMSDWYNLEYVVPKKPDYLSKDQSKPIYYSRYFIEQFIISPQKTEAKWNMVFGAIAVLITAIPSGGTSIYLFVVLNGAWGIGQMAVSSMKLQELENGEYNTPGLDRAQKLLETTGNALAVVDLAFIAKSAGRHVMNLTVESARNEMLRNIKNPAVRAGLDKVGTKLQWADSFAKDLKLGLNPANFGRSGLELAGTGGRVTSQLVDGPQVWFSSGSGGTGDLVPKPSLKIPPSFEKIIAGKKLKSHFLDHKKILEDFLGKKYPNWSQTQGTEFLEDIQKIIDDGIVKYEGLGTLNKTMAEPSHIYRGNGMTVVIRQNGEFHTLLKSGTGMDKKILIVD